MIGYIFSSQSSLGAMAVLILLFIILGILNNTFHYLSDKIFNIIINFSIVGGAVFWVFITS